jgi:hypothetical protein
MTQNPSPARRTNGSCNSFLLKERRNSMRKLNLAAKMLSAFFLAGALIVVLF